MLSWNAVSRVNWVMQLCKRAFSICWHRKSRSVFGSKVRRKAPKQPVTMFIADSPIVTCITCWRETRPCSTTLGRKCVRTRAGIGLISCKTQRGATLILAKCGNNYGHTTQDFCFAERSGKQSTTQRHTLMFRSYETRI